MVSPLIWMIVVDSLLVLLISSGYFTLECTENIVILYRGKNAITVIEAIHQFLPPVENSCRTNNLCVNPNKTIRN